MTVIAWRRSRRTSAADRRRSSDLLDAYAALDGPLADVGDRADAASR